MADIHEVVKEITLKALELNLIQLQIVGSTKEEQNKNIANQVSAFYNGLYDAIED